MLEIRPTLRALLHRPGLPALAVATLAIGIGALAAIASVASSVVFRPLPFPEPDRLVRLFHHPLGTTEVSWEASHAHYRVWREASLAFDDLAGFATVGGPSVVRVGEDLDLFSLQLVSGNFFSTLGTRPAAGRLLAEADDVVGAAPVAVVSERMWRDRFGRDPGVLGAPLEISGTSHTIVGVVPAGADVPVGAEVWVPIAIGVPEAFLTNPQIGFVNLIGRLAPERSAEEARAELDRLAREITNPELPESRHLHSTIVSLDEDLRGSTRGPVAFLVASALLVLAVSAFNVANLLALREAGRRHESAVRLGLGARWRHLWARAATETAALGLIGGAVGVALGAAAIEALVARFPHPVFRLADVGLEATGVAIAVGAVVGLSALLALALALGTRRLDPATALRSGTRSEPSAPAGLRALVVGQIAAAVVLALGSGLLWRSYERLHGADMGFDRESVLTFSLPVLDPGLATPMDRFGVLEPVLRDLEALPGVVAAGALLNRPLQTEAGLDVRVTPEGDTTVDRDSDPLFDLVPATPGALEAFGMPLVAGRGLRASDDEEAPGVVLVSRSAAERLWPGGDAVGRRLKFGGPDAPGAWLEVVGVVGDSRMRDALAPRLRVIAPHRQVPWDLGHVGVRVAEGRAPATVLPDVRAVLDRHAGGLVPLDVATTGDIVDRALAGRRFVTLLVGLLGATTVLLAAIGLYGVVAFLVSAGRRDVGIRLALGARPGDVRLLVVARATRLAAAGVLGGLAAAIVLLGVLGARVDPWLVEIRRGDPATVAAVVALLLACAVAASLGPAWRAGRVDPIAELRGD